VTVGRTFALIAFLAIILAGALAYSVLRRGLSTREEPSRVESALALTMRRLATPQAVRDRQNPIPASDAVVNEGLAHYADHCAVCHANNGSGDTAIGRGLYPKAPDMRLSRTQSLTDGELFSIIENGIRLTGMPAWGTGTPEGERDSWGLVHFIRRLPTLTEADIERMEALNPKSEADWQQEEEIRRFLSGEPTPPSSDDSVPHH
jgi:mono/diheme cytochrome c family protein